MIGKRCAKKVKLNNAGFSLVELIIAVIILGICLGPILRSFVLASKYNAQSRKNQTVTSAAESLMEGFKAYSFDELKDQFDPASGVPFKVYDTGSLETYSCTEGATINDPSFFYLYGMTYEGNKYDARVTVTPYSATNSSGNSLYGVEELDDIKNMNGYMDAVYSEDIFANNYGYNGIIDMFVTKLNTLSGQYKVDINGIISWEGNYTKDMILADTGNLSKIKVRRETTVSADGGKVNVSVIFYATVNAYPYVDADHHSKTLTIGEADQLIYKYVEDQTVYDNSVTGANLENVFMFVYPAYEPYEMEDDYVISSTSRVNYFFVKQKSRTLDDAMITVREATYEPNIDATDSDIVLYHNILMDLVTKQRNPAKTYNLSNISHSTAMELVDGLTKPEKTVLLYELKVEIFNYMGVGNTFDPSNLVDSVNERNSRLTGTMND